MVVLVSSNLAVSLVRNWVPKDIRIPVYVMIIAALVTSVQLLMNAYTYGLYQALGIFIALIVTNCVIIGRAEAYASKNPPLLAAIDGFMMGLGFPLVLLLLGGLREIIGMGTLFDGADLLLGSGPSPCASSCSMPTPACCWPSCHRGASSAWACSSPARMPSTTGWAANSGPTRHTGRARSRCPRHPSSEGRHQDRHETR